MGLPASNDQCLVSKRIDQRCQPGQRGQSMAYPEGCGMPKADQDEKVKERE